MAKNAVVKTWQLVVEGDGKRRSRPPVDLTAPTVPTNLIATAASSSQIGLTWNASTDIQSGVADYLIERSLSSGGTYVQVATSVTTSTTIGSLNAATTYYFRVKARDNAAPDKNVSAASSVANATTSSATVIPVAKLQAAGFIVVTASPYNADPNFGTDATSAIQSAIDAAYASGKTVWIPSGTYKISSTLRCYRFRTSSSSFNVYQHGIFGASVPSRPILKLSTSSLPAFTGVSPPRPMIAFMQWEPATGTGIAPPPTLTFSPYSGPGFQSGVNWLPRSADNLFAQLFNVDFDTNHNTSAEGVGWGCAQGAMYANVKVTATDSTAACFRGTGGRMAAACNLEAIGGAYAIDFDTANSSGWSVNAGHSVAGLRATGQTVAMVKPGDFVPCLVVGFEYTAASSAPVVIMEASSSTATNTNLFLDGTVETSGIAFNNTVSKGLFIRNVYVTGTGNIVKTGGTTYARTGTWKYIDEYQVNDTNGTQYANGETITSNSQMAHLSMINGTTTHTLEPISATTAIQSSAPTPPSDLRTKHIYSFPLLDSGTYLDVVADYGASTSGGDARADIQQAIDDARDAGHNRVFLPNGTYLIGAALNLHINTKLFGTGMHGGVATAVRTKIDVHSSWAPTVGEASMFTTDDDTAGVGTAFIGFMSIWRRTLTNPTNNRFTALTWRVGRASGSAFIEQHQQFLAPSATATNPRSIWKFTDHGGGRHYCFETGLGNGIEFRPIYILNTDGEPLQLYGLNTEVSKNNPSSSDPPTNVEINNASNIRIYGGKREGHAPSYIITDSTNVGIFGGGAMTTQLPYFLIEGTSDDILVSSIYIQNGAGTAATADYTLQETVSGTHTIIWPNGVALYKRGDLDDNLMGI